MCQNVSREFYKALIELLILATANRYPDGQCIHRTTRTIVNLVTGFSSLISALLLNSKVSDNDQPATPKRHSHTSVFKVCQLSFSAMVDPGASACVAVGVAYIVKCYIIMSPKKKIKSLYVEMYHAQSLYMNAASVIPANTGVSICMSYDAYVYPIFQNRVILLGSIGWRKI